MLRSLEHSREYKKSTCECRIQISATVVEFCERKQTHKVYLVIILVLHWQIRNSRQYLETTWTFILNIILNMVLNCRISNHPINFVRQIFNKEFNQENNCT